MNKKVAIKIDVVSDIVCPWCYIGKRRLEKAMQEIATQFDFEVDHLPFELNPDMPKEGRNQKEYLSAKFGGTARYQQLTDNVTKIATDEGLHFDYARQTTSPNTRTAHRLIWLARQEGKSMAVNEALMRAYFEEGVDLSVKESLIGVAVKAGLDEKRVNDLFDSEEGLAEVLYAEQLNHQRGISGVPFFIVNNQFGISGAQPVEVFVKALTQIAASATDAVSSPS
jgi:predicted DsbA family dithiol-disulfide isomerase